MEDDRSLKLAGTRKGLFIHRPSSIVHRNLFFPSHHFPGFDPRGRADDPFSIIGAQRPLHQQAGGASPLNLAFARDCTLHLLFPSHHFPGFDPRGRADDPFSIIGAQRPLHQQAGGASPLNLAFARDCTLHLLFSSHHFPGFDPRGRADDPFSLHSFHDARGPVIAYPKPPLDHADRGLALLVDEFHGLFVFFVVHVLFVFGLFFLFEDLLMVSRRTLAFEKLDRCS